MAKVIQRKRSKPARGPAAIDTGSVLDRLMAGAGVAAVISTLYLVAGLVSGQVATFPLDASGRALTEAEQAHFLGAVRVAGFVFMISLWAVMVFSIFRFRDNDVAGYVGVVGGLLCYLALPWLVGATLMQRYASPNAGSDLMLAFFRLTGKVLLIVVAIYFPVKILARVSRRPPRSQQQLVVEAEPARKQKPVAAAPRPSVLRRCWELSLCRDSLRDNCPAYKSHTPCWKRGTGCQCDPLLAQRLIQEMEMRLRGEMPENERVARERVKEQLAYRMMAHQGDSYCRECPVYDEHQIHKYRTVYWIAYPLTAGIIMLALPLISRAYAWLDLTLATLMGSLSMLPSSREALEPLMTRVYEFNGVYVFITSVALLTAAYLLDLVDWAIFRAKL